MYLPFQDIPTEFPTATSVVKQSHSTQFVVKIKLNDDEIENVSVSFLVTHKKC